MCSLQTKPCRTTETAARNGARNDICKYAAPPAHHKSVHNKSVQESWFGKVRYQTQTVFSKPHLSLSKKFRRPLKAQHVQCRPGRLTYQSSNTHPTFHPVLQWENSVEVSALRKAQLSLSAQKHLHVITGLHWWTMQLRYVLRSGGIANLPSNSKDIKNGWLLQSFLGVVETYWLRLVAHTWAPPTGKHFAAIQPLWPIVQLLKNQTNPVGASLLGPN